MLEALNTNIEHLGFRDYLKPSNVIMYHRHENPATLGGKITSISKVRCAVKHEKFPFESP